MNNKRLGTEFEKKMVKLLANQGFWAHFITPDNRGAQPFDIIAVKNDFAVAIDCKTSKDHIFRLGRLEENQIMAFEKWLKCGNSTPFIAVSYNDNIYMIEYTKLKGELNIDLDKEQV